MPTLDELLKGEQGGEYTDVVGYLKDPNYTDSQIVDITDRQIGEIKEQTSTYGEERSQLITFRADRKPDGYDLTKTTLKIGYQLADGTGGESAPINVKANSDYIQFSWLIPAAATQKAGKLLIMVYAVANGYTYKTLAKQYEIKETLEIGGTIPEPDVNWYTDFIRQMDAKIAQAASSAANAGASAAAAEKSKTDAAAILAETEQAKENAVVAIEDKCNSYAEIDKIKNVTLSGNAEGSYISVTDAASWRLSNLEVQGKSEQAQTTGENLLDISGVANVTTAGITFTNKGDGTISISGTATISASTNTIPLNLPSGSYYINSNLTGVLATIRYTKNGGNIYASNRAFSLDGTETDIIFYMQVNVGNVVNGIAKPMLNKGDAPATWEPYTGTKPAPSPDYPQVITSVENLAITACGKNLCSVNSIAAQTNPSGSIKFYNIKRKGIYTLSCDITKYPDDTATNTRVTLGCNFKDGTFKNACSTFDTTGAERDGVKRRKQATINIDKPIDNIYVMALDYSTKPGIRNAKAEDIKLEIGDTETPYEPYTGYTATLTDVTLRSLPGDAADRLEKRNGVWGIERKVAKEVLDSGYTKSITLQSINAYGIANFIINAPGAKIGTSGECMCNRLPLQLNGIAGTQTEGYLINPNVVYFRIASDRASTVDEFRAWIAENPITIQYALTTQTWEPLSDALQAELNKLESHAGTTNIFTDSSLQPNMTLEYIKDPNKVISDITTELTSIKEQIVAMQA